MKKAIVLAILVSVSEFALAGSLKCRASDEQNQNPKDVAVTSVKGAELIESKTTTYGTYQITVRHQLGDEFEAQSSLTLEAGDFASRVYNVSKKGLYQLMVPGLFLQCWFPQ